MVQRVDHDGHSIVREYDIPGGREACHTAWGILTHLENADGDGAPFAGEGHLLTRGSDSTAGIVAFEAVQLLAARECEERDGS